MGNELVTAVERALVMGDLAKLNAEERMAYYKSVCDSLGLNPLTQPFAYITLNGKLTLYARKDATDQLRSLHNISIVEMTAEDRDGVYIVTAKAQNKDGRTDISKGAVSINALKGEALANAIMKTETKAKRRVTLSICGLGCLDETEVETVPQQPQEPEPKRLEHKPASSPTVPAATAKTTPPPANGTELVQRLEQYEAKLVAAGKCRANELLTHVQVQGAKEGWGPKPAEYTAKAITWAVDCAKAFAAAHEGDAPRLGTEKLEVLVAEFRQRINDLTDDLGAIAEVEQEVGRWQKDLGRVFWEELTHALREKAQKAAAMHEAKGGKGKRAKAG